MEYLGYMAAVLIGIVLGLIGAGGSILTIPVLVYLMKIKPIEATSYSLFIVATSALIGVISYFKNKLICFKTVISFGIPSVISIFLTRRYLLHLIPSELYTIGEITITKDMVLMILLAVLMLLSSYSMIKKKAIILEDNSNAPYNYYSIFRQGIIIGILVGLVGAGGGFLIIPALVLLAKLPIKKAIGTSLAIITINSFIGFLSDFSQHKFDWPFLLVFSGLAVLGILLGSYLAKFISGAKLKPTFGWFVLIVGVYIISKELFFN
ncbi:MAG: sulfite exporter TauE/SafE family protein [Bacteroidia bacterium]